LFTVCEGGRCFGERGLAKFRKGLRVWTIISTIPCVGGRGISVLRRCWRILGRFETLMRWRKERTRLLKPLDIKRGSRENVCLY